MHAQATVHACNPALLFVILSHYTSSHFTPSTVSLCYINLWVTEHLLLLPLHNKSAALAKHGTTSIVAPHCPKKRKEKKESFLFRYNQVQSIIKTASAIKKKSSIWLFLIVNQL